MRSKRDQSHLKTTPAVGFFRVSSTDQRDGQSLNAQNTLASDYSGRAGLSIVRHWSEAESASKEKERKKFFEMIEFVKKNEIKDVIFDKVDRAVRGFKSAVII